MKILPTIILSTSIALSTFAQKIDQTTRDFDGAPPSSVSSGKSSNNNGIGASDTGAQRPIFLNTEQISAFAGFDTKVTYRSNPLTLSGDLTQNKTGIWQNTFFGGASLSPIDTDTSVVTPVFGGSWTMSDYLNDNLSSLNDYATSAYALLMVQHETGIGFRGGVSYANVRNNDTDTEDYSEFYPNIGAMKTYGLGPDTIAIVDVSGGYHLTKSDSLLGSNTQSLNNWDAALSYSIRHLYQDFVITPGYRLGYKKFTESNTINDGRKDVTHTLSVKVDYPIIENVNLSASSSYTRRNSDLSSDYKSLDAGANIGINYKF
jgi:hypothetical protein